MLPYLLGRVGETHQVALAVLAHEIREGQREGSVRAAPPETIALTLVLLAQAFLFGDGDRVLRPLSSLHDELPTASGVARAA